MFIICDLTIKGRFTHSMPFPRRTHAVPLPCRAAKGLECVFPIWFTQCGSVWFTRAMPCSDHAVLLKATAQHGRRETVMLCCGLEKNSMVREWHGHGMASVNQTRPHCVNQMGKTFLAARHGAAWERHVRCESALSGHVQRGALLSLLKRQWGTMSRRHFYWRINSIVLLIVKCPLRKTELFLFHFARVIALYAPGIPGNVVSHTWWQCS